MDAAVDPALHVAGRRSRVIADGLTVGATILGILAVALLPLLTPWAMHAFLDSAQSAAWLATDTGTTHALSDHTVNELLFGPGTFSFDGPGGTPFYDTSEVAHLDEARTLLWLLFGIAALAVLGVAVALVRSSSPANIVHAIGLGGAVTVVGVVILAVVGLFAFDPLFELFHRVFFPGGNWAFDPRTERLVQLYPFAFWQVTAAALGVIAGLLGVLVWLTARLILGPDPDLGT